MIRFLFCLLLLTACASTPVTARPALALVQAQADATKEIEQRHAQATATAQRIIFSATETAQARSDALAVTRSAAEALQTRQAMTATAQALDATQIALDKLSAAATATHAMWPTAARATSEALYSSAEQSRSVSGAVSNIAAILTVLLAAAALCGVCWLVVAALASIYDIREIRRHSREMGLESENHEAAKNAKLWAEVEAIAPARQIDDTTEGIRATLWRTRLGLFYGAGDRLGFSNRSMCPDILSNRHWGPLVQHLVGAGVLASDQTGTRWADGYDLERAIAELRSEATPLPVWEPVDIRWGGNAARVSRVAQAVTPS